MLHSNWIVTTGLRNRNSTEDKRLPGPNTTLAFILATLFGASFHLIMGGDARRLALFLLSGWVGFSLGHLLGVVFEINILNIGTLRIVSASLGAIVALVVSHVLTTNRASKKSSR
jgi:uncharacterized membrane protein YeaQ/YmgE (transglycosylase-associated protein family)